MKTFEEYIQSRIQAKDQNNELLDLNEEIRLMVLMDKYFEYCLANLDTPEKELIVPLSTFLEQYAILSAYYESLIKKQSSDIVTAVKIKPQESDYPLKAEEVRASYETLNTKIVDNVKRVAAQFKFEQHSTGGRVVTNPKRAPHYLMASILLIGSSAGLITLAHQLHLIPHFMPIFSITAISLVSALIAFTGAALFIRYGLEHYRTVPCADELTEVHDFTDKKLPKKKYDHVYYAHDYQNSKHVSETLFQKKQLALHELLSENDTSNSLNDKITRNVMLTHYQHIYHDFKDYRQGKGLLDTGMTTDYPHASNATEKTLFNSTPFEPKVNITQLKHDNAELKKTLLKPSVH